MEKLSEIMMWGFFKGLDRKGKVLTALFGTCFCLTVVLLMAEKIIAASLAGMVMIIAYSCMDGDDSFSRLLKE